MGQDACATPRIFSNRILETGTIAADEVHCVETTVSTAALGLNVAIGPVPPVSELETLWKTMESRADASFFLSWTWIRTWLINLPVEVAPELVAMRAGDRVVALGIVVSTRKYRLGLLPVTVWNLNSSGRPEYDNVTVEYNGWIRDREFDADLNSAFLEYVARDRPGAHGLSIPGQLEEVPSLATSSRLVEYAARVSTTWRVDLKAVRNAQGNYLSLLSANTRSKIRQSLKAYSAIGPVQIRRAADESIAQEFLKKLRALHIAGWESRNTQPAFGRPFFDRFHESLVSTGVPLGEIQLLRVSAGEHDIGYLYNFVHRGHIVFYQCGFDYELGGDKGRPGMVAHALAIELSANANFDDAQANGL